MVKYPQIVLLGIRVLEIIVISALKINAQAKQILDVYSGSACRFLRSSVRRLRLIGPAPSGYYECHKNHKSDPRKKFFIIIFFFFISIINYAFLFLVFIVGLMFTYPCRDYEA